MEDLIYTCRNCEKETEIVISEITPRFQSNFAWRGTYETKRQDFNLGLRQICDQYKCNIVQSPNFYEHEVIDGIHPTVESGVPKLVSAYKSVTNKLLGMKDIIVTENSIGRKDKNINHRHRNVPYDSHYPKRQQHRTDYYEQNAFDNNYNPKLRDMAKQFQRGNLNMNNKSHDIQNPWYYNSGSNMLNDNNSYYGYNSSQCVQQAYDNTFYNKYTDQSQEKLKGFLKAFLRELS